MTETMSDDYVKDFDSGAFMNDLELSEDNNYYHTVLTGFHEAFANNDIRGGRLLDIGTGPSAHSVFSASAHVDSIFLSDIAPQNLAFLSQWHQGKNKHNLEPFFKFIVDVEGKGELPSDRERSVRNKVSGILPIDLHQEAPFNPCIFPEFDVITSLLCFEAAAQNIDQYRNIARRVKSLLRKGGHLVLFGLLEHGNYTIGKYTFRDLYITMNEVKDIWKNVGMDIIYLKQGKHHNKVEGRKHFIMVARK